MDYKKVQQDEDVLPFKRTININAYVGVLKKKCSEQN